MSNDPITWAEIKARGFDPDIRFYDYGYDYERIEVSAQEAIENGDVFSAAEKKAEEAKPSFLDRMTDAERAKILRDFREADSKLAALLTRENETVQRTIKLMTFQENAK